MNYKKNDQVIYDGEVCTVFDVEPDGLVLDTGLAPAIYEHANFDEVKMFKEYVAPCTILTDVWEAQKKEADINAAKPISELKVGDLVWLYMFGLKNCGDCIRTMVGCAPYRRLSRIEKIISDLTIEDVDSESFDQGEGGSASDCLPDDFNPYNPTPEQRDTFYSCVTLIKLKDGRHLFCDAQGYDYPRYILVSNGWEKMFEAELTAERERIAEYERKCEEERLENRAKQKADAESFVATTLKDFKPAKTPKANVKAILHILCPGIPFEIKQSTYGSTTVTVSGSMDNISKLRRAWENMLDVIHYQTGETITDWDDQYGSYTYEPVACALPAAVGFDVYFFGLSE